MQEHVLSCIVQFQKIYILPSQKGLEFPGGGGILEKIPSVGEVWTFSGITHYVPVIVLMYMLVNAEGCFYFVFNPGVDNCTIGRRC